MIGGTDRFANIITNYIWGIPLGTNNVSEGLAAYNNIEDIGGWIYTHVIILVRRISSKQTIFTKNTIYYIHIHILLWLKFVSIFRHRLHPNLTIFFPRFNYFYLGMVYPMSSSSIRMSILPFLRPFFSFGLVKYWKDFTLIITFFLK